VPRPETEILVDRCLALLDGVPAPRVLDVGTGTGAIALALKSERPDAEVLATDNSGEALALARENAAAVGLDVSFVEADLTDGVEGTFTLVASNPPYVLAAELDALEPEVRDWEPRAALVDEGQTERLAAGVQRLLDGYLVLEVHEDRAREVAALLDGIGFADVRVTPDLTLRERIVEGRWAPSNG